MAITALEMGVRTFIIPKPRFQRGYVALLIAHTYIKHWGGEKRCQRRAGMPGATNDVGG